MQQLRSIGSRDSYIFFSCLSQMSLDREGTNLLSMDIVDLLSWTWLLVFETCLRYWFYSSNVWILYLLRFSSINLKQLLMSCRRYSSTFFLLPAKPIFFCFSVFYLSFTNIKSIFLLSFINIISFFIFIDFSLSNWHLGFGIKSQVNYYITITPLTELIMIDSELNLVVKSGAI